LLEETVFRKKYFEVKKGRLRNDKKESSKAHKRVSYALLSAILFCLFIFASLFSIDILLRCSLATFCNRYEEVIAKGVAYALRRASVESERIEKSCLKNF
jgi:hypothetical protein